LFPS
jgi:hypothetical protein